MTTPARNYPFGPILDGDDVILIKGTNVAVLMNNVISFVPVTSSVITTNILVLKVSGTQDKLTAKVKLPISNINQYLTSTLTLSNTVLRLKLDSKYSDPPDGYSLFSGVDYTLGTNTLYWVAIAFSQQTTKDVSTAYCTTPVENPIEAAKIFLNKTVAWTRLQDCERNILYSYCLKGETCGKCFGPCDSGTCHYSAPGSAGYNGDPFLCSDKAADKQPDLPINLQGWFIVIVIILVFLAIGVALYYASKGYFTTSEEKTVTYTTTHTIPVSHSSIGHFVEPVNHTDVVSHTIPVSHTDVVSHTVPVNNIHTDVVSHTIPMNHTATVNNIHTDVTSHTIPDIIT